MLDTEGGIMFFVNRSLCEPIVEKNNSKIYELTAMFPTHGNFSVAYFELPPNESGKKHFHPNVDETYFIVKGEPTVLINNEEKLVGAGDLIFVPKNSVHCITNDSQSTVGFIALCVPGWTPECEILV